MTDLSHLTALEAGLSHERARLDTAKSAGERAHRQVWVRQYEKQIADEKARCGVADVTCDLSDDELLAELLA